MDKKFRAFIRALGPVFMEEQAKNADRMWRFYEGPRASPTSPGNIRGLGGARPRGRHSHEMALAALWQDGRASESVQPEARAASNRQGDPGRGLPRNA